MRQADWAPFLMEWNRELLACPEIANDLPDDVRASGWLGYPPATEQQIAQAEERLGIALPNSYREFLKVTNGWRIPTYFVEKLLQVQEIDWYATKYREHFDAWLQGLKRAREYYGERPPVPDEQYFVYGPEQRPEWLRSEYVETALAISVDPRGEQTCLLNPRIVTPEGEWEAWFFAVWLPGARRYRSFWEMMQDERQTILQLITHQET